MGIAFVKPLFAKSVKDATSDLVLSGSSVVSAGQTIFVGLGTSNVDNPPSITDNLGNTYSVVSALQQGSFVVAWLFKADVTNAGTLTAITINQPGYHTAGAIAVVFSGVGAVRGSFPGHASSNSSSLNAIPGSYVTNLALIEPDDLWIAAFVQRSSNAFANETDTSSAHPYPAVEPVPEQVTTGGAASSNLSVGLLYYCPTVNPGVGGALIGKWTGGADGAASGGAFAASVASPIDVDFEMSIETLQQLSFDVIEMGPSLLATFSDAPTGRIRMRA